MPNAGDLIRASDIPADTGWVNRAAELESGYTEELDISSRRIGNVVYWRGRVDVTTNWGSAFTNNRIITDIGDEWTPDEFVVEVMASGAAGTDEWFRVAIGDTGTFDVRPQQSTSSSSVYLTLAYIVDNPAA